MLRAGPRIPRTGLLVATQIPVFAEAGYRVLAPDQRGYGGSSSRPDAVEDYDIDAADRRHRRSARRRRRRAGRVHRPRLGRDGGVAHRAAAPGPGPCGRGAERAAGSARHGAAPPSVGARVFGEDFFYILWFQEPGVADAELGRRSGHRCAAMWRLESSATEPRAADAGARRGGLPGPDPETGGCPTGSGRSEFDHYVDEFTRTGFTGAAELVP